MDVKKQRALYRLGVGLVLVTVCLVIAGPAVAEETSPLAPIGLPSAPSTNDAGAPRVDPWVIVVEVLCRPTHCCPWKPLE
jgi:hypothetical protein